MTGEENRLNIKSREDEDPSMEDLDTRGRTAKSNNDESYKKLVNVAVVIVLVALIFIALFSFFFSMQEAIVALFDPRYQALMQAVFSLIVLVMGVYMIKMFLPK
ncbi:hypothetical protein [Methanococcoides sp. AM1]|uniref:hypothetical protein n=1 Tax=Methanococcoides sp. AM1 TaxID=1201011 RepID=UPI00108331C9|nr:hypothetical protein [Methanococcoides sp. AM1]